MIPTKEQFFELNGLLDQSVDLFEASLNCSRSYFPDKKTEIFEFLVEDKLPELIKPAVDIYIEQFGVVQLLPAWNWLSSQQNFIKAKNRVFKHWPLEEKPDTGLEKFIIEKTLSLFQIDLKKKEELVSSGTVYEQETNESWLIKKSPIELMQFALKKTVGYSVRYRKWLAGLALAQLNYHYGQVPEILVRRKARVDALILAWEEFGEQIELAQSDIELTEYFSNTIKRATHDRGLLELRELHNSNSLYFIDRQDETVLERLFIKEMALLHSKLFYEGLRTAVISDLFYLDGMKSAPTERTIQRVAKSAISNLKERKMAKYRAIDLMRQKK